MKFDSKKADVAFREDRERFFAVADTCAKDSYLYNKLTAAQKELLEDARTEWRNMTEEKGYPNINFPLTVPPFMKVKLFSSHIKGNPVADKDPDFD